MSGAGKIASSSALPDFEYSVRYGCDPQPTNTLPLASSCVLPWVPAFSVGLCRYCATSVAVCAVVSSLSTRPREGPDGFANGPVPLSSQQASSNMLTSSPECNSTSCCHSKDAPAPSVKLSLCWVPSVHWIAPVA